jgi:hypothetical protein
MKANAKNLQELLNSLKRGATDEETGAVAALLREYGLGEGFHNVPNGLSSSDFLENMVKSAVGVSNGVILIHDLFCLINRGLKLERIFSPKEFLAELRGMKSVQIMEISGYKIVVNLTLSDLNAKVVDFLVRNTMASVSEISSRLEIGNPRILSLLLGKIAQTFGGIVLDSQAHPEQVWYLNRFF